MSRNVWTFKSISRLVALCAAVVAATAGASAQSQPTTDRHEDKPAPGATPSPTPSRERRFFADILRDQRAIWTSPFRLGRDDAKWLVPLGLAAGVLVASDRHIAGALDDSGTQVRVGEAVSKLGSFYTVTGASAVLYAFGRYRGKTRARETAMLGFEALANGVIVYSVLKAATQRPRPLVGDRRGRFFDGGNSFPSAHTFHAWALAAVVANQYGDKPAVRFVAYGLATTVGVARVLARKHFPSDVLIGGALGYGIGRYVYRANQPGGGSSSGGGSQPSTLLPEIAPSYDRRSRAYGLRLTWGF